MSTSGGISLFLNLFPLISIIAVRENSNAFAARREALCFEVVEGVTENEGVDMNVPHTSNRGLCGPPDPPGNGAPTVNLQMWATALLSYLFRPQTYVQAICNRRVIRGPGAHGAVASNRARMDSRCTRVQFRCRSYVCRPRRGTWLSRWCPKN